MPSGLCLSAAPCSGCGVTCHLERSLPACKALLRCDVGWQAHGGGRRGLLRKSAQTCILNLTFWGGER